MTTPSPKPVDRPRLECDCGWTGKREDLKSGLTVDEGRTLRVYVCPKCGSQELSEQPKKETDDETDA